MEVDSKYPDNIKQETKHFPFAPENKKTNPDDFNDFMKEINSDNYSPTKNLICDWTDKKNFLIHHRMIKFYVRHGMVFEKNREIM